MLEIKLSYKLVIVPLKFELLIECLNVFCEKNV
jgi:hypothetical protein